MRSILIAILLVFSLLSFSQKKLVDKVVSIVGNEVVLLSDIELQYQQMKLENAQVTDDTKCLLFASLLSQKMFLQQAKLDSILITEDEIESELNRRIRYFISMIGSEERLEEYYGKSILEIKDEFRSDIEEQLLSQRMQSTIFENVNVTPEEVKEFFNSIPSDSVPFFNAEVEVGQLVIKPEISATQKQLAIEKIEGIKERLDNGEDFEILAISYSDDLGTSSDGGNLDYFGRGQMVTEFEGVAFKMDVGEISEVFESKFGYHVIKLTDKKGDRVKASHILIKPKVTSFELQVAKEKLDNVYNLILTDSISFTKAVKQFSNDEETINNGGMLLNPQTNNMSFEIDQLDKTVYFSIEKLNEGEFTKPEFFKTTEGEQAYRILYLKSETEAHEANLKDDYYKIKGAAQSKKEEEALHNWIIERASETYLLIDKRYENCSALKDWYKFANKTSDTTYE